MGSALSLFGLFVFLLGAISCTGTGQSPSSERIASYKASPQWKDDSFQNKQKTWMDLGSVIVRVFGGVKVENKAPEDSIAVMKPEFSKASITGLAMTWFGHSSALVEIDGTHVLIDPFWSEYASPFDFMGPKRWSDPIVELKELDVDVVLISHDHYDHLDMVSIQTLKSSKAVFVVPLGIGSHLEYWGIPRERISELDWWQSKKIGSVEITATPARHSSGRINPKSNQTLWAGFAIVSPKHRVWYSGDTGFHDEISEIGNKLGPFDLTLVEAGQYDSHWPDSHLGPELAVEAHRLVKGKYMVPIHWALLRLGEHPWTEPVERVLAAAACDGTKVLTPRPGERLEPSLYFSTAVWWPKLPWRPVTEYSVLSTLNGEADHRFSASTCTALRN